MPNSTNNILTNQNSDKEIMLALEENMIGKFIYLSSNAAGMSVIKNGTVVIVNS